MNKSPVRAHAFVADHLLARDIIHGLPADAVTEQLPCYADIFEVFKTRKATNGHRAFAAIGTPHLKVTSTAGRPI